MAAGPDHYQTLGIKRDSSADDIRKAYRRLARKYHPDLNPGDKAAEEKFKQVQEAYDILSEPKKKKMYDQYGFYSDSGFPNQPPPNAGAGGFNFGGFDFSEAFQDAQSRPGAGGRASGMGDFSDLFSQFFGRSRENAQQRPTPQPGSDLEYALTVDFWQAVKGTQTRLNISRLEPCATCKGTGSTGSGSATCPQCSGSGQVTQMAGAMRFSLQCPKCHGTGRLKNVCPACRGEGRTGQSEVVDVRIPAGVSSGARLRVPGKGSAGTLGAQAGDLYITVNVAEHPVFRREGDDILLTVPVKVSEAGLGARIEVPTVDGRALLKIPQGTVNGQKFRLREKGIFNSRRNTRGDLIVEIAIQAPDVRDERARDLLRKLDEVDKSDPRGELWSKI